MKMLPVKNVFSARIIYYNFLQTSMYVCHHHFLSIVIVFTCSLASSLFTVILLTITSEDVCGAHSLLIRNVKCLKSILFCNMRCFIMFVTAVCVLFLLKYRS